MQTAEFAETALTDCVSDIAFEIKELCRLLLECCPWLADGSVKV